MPSLPQTFRPRGAPTSREQDRARGSARARGYNARWDRVAARFKQTYPLCRGCEAIDRVEATAVVDHIEPHRGDQGLFWAPDNWQPLCRFHHDAVKRRLEHEWQSGRLRRDQLAIDSDRAIALTRELLG